MAAKILPRGKKARARSKARPKTRRKPAKPLSDAERLAKGELPATALRQIRIRLDLACSTVMVVAGALREQNVELDDDAADVLSRHVSDVVFSQIQHISQLLGEGDEDYEDDEDDDGGAV